MLKLDSALVEVNVFLDGSASQARNSCRANPSNAEAAYSGFSGSDKL
jgi:hypothetical protein